jgi:hypothetical protein
MSLRWNNIMPLRRKHDRSGIYSKVSTWLKTKGMRCSNDSAKLSILEVCLRNESQKGRKKQALLLIHRPFTDIHLPMVWNGLFYMAVATFILVIYIIIATEMKTDQTTNIAAIYVKRMHSFMAVAGIVTAIICALILMRETDLSRHESEQSGIVEGPKSVITHRVLELTDLSVHAILLRLK